MEEKSNVERVNELNSMIDDMVEKINELKEHVDYYKYRDMLDNEVVGLKAMKINLRYAT